MKIIYFLISICYVFGCSTNENTQNDDLTNTSWIVTSLIGNDMNYNLGDSLNLSLGITFLSKKDSNISGVCNGGLSNYNSDTNGAFSFDNIALTEIACKSIEHNKLESNFMDILYQIENWRIDGDALTLLGSSGSLVLVRLEDD